jgi:hypothetical protein
LPSITFFSSTKRNKTDTGFFEIKFYTKRILRYTMSCYLIHIVSTRITASVVRVNVRCTREQQVLRKLASSRLNFTLKEYYGTQCRTIWYT